MSWFDEQLQTRLKKDNEGFSDALDSVAAAVMGKRLSEALSSESVAQSALEEILRYYHIKMKSDEIPKNVTSIDEQIEYRIRPFGIMRRNVVLEKGWYHNAVGAMLGTLKEDGRAVALIPGKMSGYFMIDFMTGKKTKLNRKNAKLLDAEATAFYKPLPMKSLKIKDLLIYMGSLLNTSDIIMYVGVTLIVTLLGLLSPMFTKWLFSNVLESGSYTMLAALTVFMICFTICRLLISTFQTLINARMGIKQNIAVQAAVMSRIISLPASFFKEYSSGELTQRAMYVQSLCSMIFDSLTSVGFTSLFSFVYIGQIFVFAPSLVLPSLIITLLTVGFSIILMLARMKISEKRMLLSSKTSGFTYSTITGIQKIKLAGAEKRMFSRWAAQYSKEAAITYNPPVFLTLGSTISLAFSLIGTIVIYYLAVSTGVAVSDYYAFNTAYGMVSSAFAAFTSITATLANIRPSLNMARPILEAEPEVAEGRLTVTELKGAVELSDISFRYDEKMPWVIDKLSLKIKPGEYLAIVGSTGCGKSTLMRLLLGFEKPQKGVIYYDRKDMTRLDLKSLRRNIGTVMQDGKLFMGDIFSNIIISAPQLTLEDAWKAAELASLDDDIRQMPMGMNTLISEGQGGISGGQKQRMMIARALAPKPKILMFDEATSALDNVTQKKVSEAIDTLKCTRIVIAHRLSTIRHADRIICLEGGKIIEEGTYEDLINKKGYFASLVERQRLDVEVD